MQIFVRFAYSQAFHLGRRTAWIYVNLSTLLFHQYDTYFHIPDTCGVSNECRSNKFAVKVWETSKEVEKHPGDSFDKRNPSSKSVVDGNECRHYEYGM
jgi:hypothetical protein